MKAVSGNDLAKLARKKGWEIARVQGSHHIFKKEDRWERLVIPIHGNRTLKRPATQSDENDCGIRRRTIKANQRMHRTILRASRGLLTHPARLAPKVDDPER